MRHKRRISCFVMAIVALLTFVSCQDDVMYLGDNSVENTKLNRSTHIEGCKVALIHFNPELGNRENNINKLTLLITKAFKEGANVIVTPELATSGYCITKQEVMNGLGMAAPFEELNEIEKAAKHYNGYVFVGLPEIDEELAYNTFAVFGPEGYLTKQRKRGKSEWHEVGNLPYDVLPTPYGDIGYIICSDEYLPDLTRILAIKGADIIVSGANWWGEGISATQIDIWKTNAHDNDVWQFIANRWGEEQDTRYGVPYDYDMNTAPSAVVNNKGEVEFTYKSSNDIVKRDTIFYYDVRIPEYRKGNNFSHSYSLNNRKPSAYTAIGNGYYNPDNGNLQFPNLPEPKEMSFSALSYVPNDSFTANSQTVKSLLVQQSTEIDVLVLPAFGLGNSIINDDEIEWTSEPQIEFLSAISKEYNISMITLTVRTGESPDDIGTLVVRDGLNPFIVPKIHNRGLSIGSSNKPCYVDLYGSRIGIVNANDFNFPEITTSLAKVGVDVVLVSSNLVGENTNDNYSWTIDQLESMLLARSNHGVHLVLSDWTGRSFILRSEWGSVAELIKSDSTQRHINLSMNSSDTRMKYLNRYQSFDLTTLLNY